MKKLETSHISGTVENGAASVEIRLAVPQKDKLSDHMTKQFHS